MTCKHENADHLMPGDMFRLCSCPEGDHVSRYETVALVEQFRCVDCGAWLSLGDSDEHGSEQVEIEIRAAEIVATYEPTLADVAGEHASDEEAIGWALHRDGGPDDVPRTDAAWSGWFAREVYDAIHEIGEDLDAEDEVFGDGEWPDNLPTNPTPGPNGCTCGFNGDCNCRFIP